MRLGRVFNDLTEVLAHAAKQCHGFSMPVDRLACQFIYPLDITDFPKEHAVAIPRCRQSPCIVVTASRRYRPPRRAELTVYAMAAESVGFCGQRLSARPGRHSAGTAWRRTRAGPGRDGRSGRC